MTNIDIKILNDYSKFINLRQVCLISDVNYNTIKGKVRKYKLNLHTYLTETESKKIKRGFKSIGITPHSLTPEN